MYIAFMLVLSDMKKVNIKYFHHFVNALLTCKNDKNIIHLFICATHNLHYLDYHLKQFKLFHLKSTEENYIDKRHECYQKLILTSPYEYHWIIHARPDVLIFDKNIFYNIRQKYSSNFIHARARYYTGPENLNKNEKSYWNIDDKDSYKNEKTNKLVILDNNIFFVPQFLSYKAFKKNNYKTINQNVHFKTISDNSIEKQQGILWYNEKIPLNIIHLVFVPPEDMLAYNVVES